jgi:hypothetical protein
VQQPEITFIVTYRCPSCQAALEARTSEAPGWLRCPKCGRASLPPDTVRMPRRDPASASPGEDILVIGPAIEFPGMEPGAGEATRAYPAGSVRRVVLTVGLLMSLMGFATAFFEGNFVNVAIFGAVVLSLGAILGFTTRRR